MFGCIISTIFEVVGIGSIPIFAMAITDVNSLKTYLPTFISSDFLIRLIKKIVMIGAVRIRIGIYCKKFIFYVVILYPGKILIDLRYTLTNKIFKYYINLPYDEHSNLNPGIVIRQYKLILAVHLHLS